MKATKLAVLWAFLTASIGAAKDPVDFNRDIRPILSKKCLSCHGQDDGHRAAGLRLDKRDGAIAKLESEAIAIKPGNSAKSELLARIASDDPDVRMPPASAADPLTKEQIDLVRRWIDEGAPYAEHWAFVKPKKPANPKLSDESWPRVDLDRFVLARLDREKLTPSPEADKHALVRRLSFDLRGLPPTPAEVREFLGDTSADAYEKLVDRFLADPAYGERWARMWLDLSRYADSRGYGSDPLRVIWRYRDWTIDAFNRNLPYDQFTIEQIAGDLLPNPTLEQRMATAFHRNTMTNTEGGTDDEEFRIEAVRDRVDTTVLVWMGLTMGCAKCHTHKYDPITHEEYYRFFALFNQTADRDLPSEDPVIPAPTPEIQRRVDEANAKIASLQKRLDTPTPELANEQAKWEEKVRARQGWTTLAAVEAKPESGAILKTLEDGSILASGTNPEQDTYTIQLKTSGNPTAIRLEAIPDASLPNKASGRSPAGDFVLSKFSVSQGGDGATAPILGRYVRIELPGASEILSLAEVEVFGDADNVARRGTATQSSTAYEGPAALAIDGKTDGHYFNAKSTSHTAIEKDPWWEVDLGGETPIQKIVVWNRTDGGTGARLDDYRLLILGADRKPLWKADDLSPPAPQSTFAIAREREIVLQSAIADYAPKEFPVAQALKQADVSRGGWSNRGQATKPHAATFFVKPGQTIGAAIVVKIEHRYKQTQNTLGRFRLSTTTDLQVNLWAAIPTDVLAIIDQAKATQNADEAKKASAYYRSIAPSLQPVRNEIAQLEKSRPEIPTLPVMVELPKEQQRTSNILIKGSFLNKGKTVEPGVLATFHPLPKDAPLNRLGVAKWLIDRDNPLTARVAVNRFWAQLFGGGIVETEEDFGMQGDLPGNAELLDSLAVDFMTDWNVKRFLKMIVTSATYRQSSKATPTLLERDPRNRFYARAPRYRLEAEMVRDQALALSGLLSRKIGGPSVFPLQPDGLWRAAFNGERTWATSTGEDRYRRALYTFWRRTVPYPSMATFDAPSREICAIRRIRTNTPLQAFVTLNDPVYIEAAQALGRRLATEGGKSAAERARYGIELCLARPATEEQVKQLVALYDSELAHYQKDSAAAQAIATEPLGPLPKEMNAAEQAAWTIIANVLLNLDGVLTKG